ncbi:MAG: peptidoglycan-binding protein [Paracoccaceae bacterium]
MPRLRSLAAGLALAAVALSADAAGNLALVIGNKAYRHAPDAESARLDALAVSRALRDAGYTVTLGIDLERVEMKRVIDGFLRELPEAEKVVVYYTGHAMRSGGRSYLSPTDMEADSLADVVFDGVPFEIATGIAAATEAGAAILIDVAQLDGFPPRPFADPGFADPELPNGVILVSAAPPGQAVRRSANRESRFARLIVDRLLQPGQSLVDAVRDGRSRLWASGSVARDFALVDAPEPVIDADADLAREIELAYWRAAERTGRAEDYRGYLARYPNGLFAPLAERRLREAEIRDDPKRALEAAEAALELTPLRKRRLQSFLDALGHNPGQIDGIVGPGTRRAIRAWQRANGFEAHGYLTAAAVAQISEQGREAVRAKRAAEAEERRRAQAEEERFWQETGATGRPRLLRSYLERYPEGRYADEARERLSALRDAREDRRERQFWQETQNANTAEAYREYLARYEDGLFAVPARRRLAIIEEQERKQAVRERHERIEVSLGLNRADQRSVERRLFFLGFNPGEIDGRFDERSRFAIRGYQTSRELDVTGYMNRPTLLLLVRETGGRRFDDQGVARVIDRMLQAFGGQ